MKIEDINIIGRLGEKVSTPLIKADRKIEVGAVPTPTTNFKYQIMIENRYVGDRYWWCKDRFNYANREYEWCPSDPPYNRYMFIKESDALWFWLVWG